MDHPAVQHINGDLYHMLAEERHIDSTILEYGHKMNDLREAEILVADEHELLPAVHAR